MNKFYFSTAVTMCLFSYSLLLSLPGSTLLREPDTFWQIRTGQWILEHGTVPVTDFYSFTAFGQRWISGQWLSEILFALAFDIAHWRGVVILSAVSCSVTIAFVALYLARNLDFSVAIGWVALTVVAITPPLCGQTTYIFIHPFIDLGIILLDSHDSKDFRPPTSVLFLLMILWANFAWQFYNWALIVICLCGVCLLLKSWST